MKYLKTGFFFVLLACAGIFIMSMSCKDPNKDVPTDTVVTITFDANGGEYTGPKTITLEKGSSMGNKYPQDPTLEDFNFAGWYYGTTLYEWNTPVEQNITLTAEWTRDIPVSFSYLIQDGSSAAATTTLTLIFNRDIEGLEAADITLTPGSTGATMGELTGLGSGVYNLEVSGITESGSVTVAVEKTGYSIIGGPRSVTVYPFPAGAITEDVAFTNLTANGSATATTSTLTLTFDKDIAGFGVADITLSGSTGATRGSLSRTGTGVYTLAVSNITASGNVTVAIAKPGFTFTPASKDVTVYPAPAVAFTNLTQNGSATATTSTLTLTFDKDITGLAATDITLTPGSTGATKGALSRTGTGTYNLAISGVTAGGSVTVAAAKTGFNITGSPKQVTIFYRTPTGNQGSTWVGKTAKMTIGAKENLISRIDAFDPAGRTLTWQSNATGVATVTNGIVTAVGFTAGGTSTSSSAGTGTATITVTASGAAPNTDSFTINTTMESQTDISTLPALKEQFKDFFLIGNITRGGSADYSGGQITNERLKRHFNVLTAENEMKPSAYGGSRNGATVSNLTFGTPDAFVNAATTSGFKVHAHVLLWHSQNSTWITQIGNESNATTATNAMKDYITKVVDHYKGKIYSWDVLNEVFPDGVSASANWKTAMRDNNPWFKAIGSGFVYQGFLAARLADPTAILYYNDYNLDSTGKATMVRDMVSAVNQEYAREYPSAGRKLIEGIGMQSHHNTDVSATSISNSLNNLFRPLGVKISISEIDVLSMGYNDFANSTGDGTNKASQSIATNNQKLRAANLYAQYFQVFRTNADIIERVTFWGLFDNASWRSGGLPLPFEGDPSNSLTPTAIRAKPAYYMLIGTLD